MNDPTDAKKVVDLMSVLLKSIEERRVQAANRPRAEKEQLRIAERVWTLEELMALG